tara:strand:- start:529 stop:714 length:186 start_codon:yes stop_codon:yes gene_type:complete
MANKMLVEALQKEANTRSEDLLKSDPTMMYLRGAIDALNGNIKVNEDDDGVAEKETGKKSD